MTERQLIIAPSTKEEERQHKRRAASAKYMRGEISFEAFEAAEHEHEPDYPAMLRTLVQQQLAKKA